MEMFKSLVWRLVREEEGAAATEYAILVAAIALAVSVAVTQFDLGGIFTRLGTYVGTFIP